MAKSSSGFEAFLTSRTQQVLVEGVKSGCSTVSSGVPQGSVLGPLLFVIYINDMPDQIQTPMKMFADDSKLFGPARTAQDRVQLQDDLHKVGEWSQRWQLPFNLEKCKVLHLGTGNPRTSYMLLGRTLATTEKEKDLGVIVDSTLKFHTQTTAAVAKANKHLGIIRRSFANLIRRLCPCFLRPW